MAQTKDMAQAREIAQIRGQRKSTDCRWHRPEGWHRSEREGEKDREREQRNGMVGNICLVPGDPISSLGPKMPHPTPARRNPENWAKTKT